MGILDKIIIAKKSRLEVQKKTLSLENLRKDSLNYNDSYNIAERYDIPLLISGGINSIQDIKKIIKDNDKIEGVVVGKSIYENKIKLEELKKLDG